MENLSLTSQELHLVFQSITEYAIFALDTAGRVTMWNEGAERVFGHCSDEIIGQSGAFLFTPDDRARDAHHQEMRTAEETGRASDERFHVRKDGTRFFASGLMFPIRDATGALTGFVKVCRDLSDRRRWEQALIEAHETLEERVAERTEQLSVELSERKMAEQRARGLLARLIRLQEDERRRIARDLHDHLGQQVTALHLQLETLKQDLRANGGPATALERIHTLFNQLDKDLRFFTWELRPGALYNLGLVPALTDFVAAFSDNYRLPTTFEVLGFADGRLPEDVEINLYRIAQEALNNTYKHAQATRADVLLQASGNRVILTVTDNGVGFVEDITAEREPHDSGMGLDGMKERAALVGGSLTVETKPGEGTSVIAIVPANAEAFSTTR